MSLELTNLLPPAKAKQFRREYFIRLATTAVVMLAALVFAECLLLIPSYFYERQTIAAESEQLSRLTASAGASQDQDLQKHLAALQSETAFLQSLAGAPTASTALRAVLAVPRPGIILTGLSFNPPRQRAPGTMQLGGVASTRETLRSYDAALAALPFVTNADLPISVYAKATNIPFSITLTGSFTP